jgi:TonB family protein
MPLNVRRVLALFFLVTVSYFAADAQTSADVMRERVAKAKAYIAVKNFNAAIYELENIRRETSDATVNGVINVLLMNSYLEQGDYKRAQDFLGELAKNNKPNAAANYLSVAGQVVRGAKIQFERYKGLGLNVADRNLPLEAATDIEKMRQTLELVVEQSKVLGKDKAQTSNAMALLEEATNARRTLAKDDFDANRWKNEAADAREVLADSRSVVVNAVNDTGSTVLDTVATGSTTATNPNSAPVKTLPFPVPVASNQIEQPAQQTNQTVAANNNTNNTANVKETPKEEAKKTDEQPKTSADSGEKNVRTRVVADNNQDNKTDQSNVVNTNPLEVGSLIEYATQRVNPIYPPQARTVRQTGIVKVELIIDEKGQVASVGKLSGPMLLQTAARDAVRRWKFKPFMRDGQPVKATGFVNFNFNL